MKRYEVATTWINLENIVVSKKSQTQNTTHYMILLYEMSTIGKSIGAESRFVVIKVLRKSKW